MMAQAGSEDDDEEYIAGDPDRAIGEARCRIRPTLPGPAYWRGLSVSERIAVARWVSRGDLLGLFAALVDNPSSPGLRSFAAEALAGGPETGWKIELRRPVGAGGGRTTKADKAKLAALVAALLSGCGDIATLARAIAGNAVATRSRKGRINNPMAAAMVGLLYHIAYERLGSATAAKGEVAQFYGRLNSYDDKNIDRLITAFNSAGGSTMSPRRRGKRNPPI